MSRQTQAKFPAFHSAEKIKECGPTPGNPRSVDKLCVHMAVFQKEDIMAQQGVPGIIPLKTGHINGIFLQGPFVLCQFFRCRNVVSAFPIYFPSFLKETVNSQ